MSDDATYNDDDDDKERVNKLIKICWRLNLFLPSDYIANKLASYWEKKI